MNPLWRIELLGQLRAVRGQQAVTRFPTRKAAALLAYLAYHRHREHPREVLVEILWPESDPEAARNRLRVTLASLRQIFEPPEIAPGSVLAANRLTLRLRPEAITTDVAEFEADLAAAAASEDAERIRHLTAAQERYGGPLLPGFYEDWISAEQERLAERLLEATRELSRLLRRAGNPAAAHAAARRAVALDPMREATHLELMQLYAETGETAAALRQFGELARILQDEFGVAPSPTARALAARLAQPGPAPEPVEVAGRSAVNGGPVPSFAPPPPPPAPQPEALPLPLTRFFGRETELAELEALLAPPKSGDRVESKLRESSPSTPPLSGSPVRLLTLTGPGGSGKTRLALELAHQMQDAFGGAVSFVSLVEVTDARQIPGRILACLRCSPRSEADPLEQVASALTSRRTPILLILDNLEHLLTEPEESGGASGTGASPPLDSRPADAALLVRELLERVPPLTCLVTSRRPLEVRGETIFPVEPLPVPGREMGEWGSAEMDASISALPHSPISSYPSVQLFLDRARAVRPDFRLTEENQQRVAELCARLDGLPLALELASAWVPLLTPAQMLARLAESAGQRSALLSDRRRDLPQRHRTLGAAMDWSFELLPPDLQRFFLRLSVFRGSWSLEAAEAVCGCVGVWVCGCEDPSSPTPIHPHTHTPTHPQTLDALAHLHRASLILCEESADGSEMRFRMLETLREYARGHLSPDEEEDLCRRHCEWYATFAETTVGKLHGCGAEDCLVRLTAEEGNFWAALHWAQGMESAPDGDEPELPLEDRRLNPGTRLAAALGAFWVRRGLLRQGEEVLRTFLARQGPVGPREAPEAAKLRARALNAVGLLRAWLGRCVEARASFEEALALCREIDAPSVRNHALFCLASMDQRLGDYAAARRGYQEALALKRASGDTLGLAHGLSSVGLIAQFQGDYVAARAAYEEALALSRALSDGCCEALALNHLGLLAQEEGDLPGARAALEESFAIRQRLHDRPGTTRSLRELGLVSYRLGDVREAQTLLQQSLTRCLEVGERSGLAASHLGLGLVARDRGDLPSALTHLQESLAIRRRLEDRYGLAECLEAFATLALYGPPAPICFERAARSLGAAAALRERLGTPLAPSLRAEHERTCAALQEQLSIEGFSAALAQGATLTLERVLNEVLSSDK